MYKILIILLLFTGCKKNNCIKTTKPQTVIPQSNENYNVSDSLILALNWKIIAKFDANNSSIRMWKLQAIDDNQKQINYYIIIDNVPADKYWATGFQLNDIILGQFLIKLL